MDHFPPCKVHPVNKGWIQGYWLLINQNSKHTILHMIFHMIWHLYWKSLDWIHNQSFGDKIIIILLELLLILLLDYNNM